MGKPGKQGTVVTYFGFNNRWLSPNYPNYLKTEWEEYICEGAHQGWVNQNVEIEYAQ